MAEKYPWRGEGPPPPCWEEPDGTIVFRDYESYVFDDDIPVPNPPSTQPGSGLTQEGG